MANKNNIAKGQSDWQKNINNFMNEYFGNDSGKITSGITYLNGAKAYTGQNEVDGSTYVTSGISIQTLSSASGISAIIHGGVAIDPANGQFRFDFPAPAFAMAGSYKQAFFRLMKDGQNVATLEFNMTVLSDMVISGIVPSTYISPLDDILEQYYKKYTDADADVLAIKAKWEKTIGDVFDKWTGDYQTIENTVTNLQTQLQTLTAEIQSDQIVTIPMMQGWIDKIANIIANMHVLTILKVGRMTLADSDNIYPTIHAYIYQYGAGVAQANIDIGGGSTVYDIPVRAERLTPTSINIYIDSEAAKKLFSGFSMVDNPEVSVDGSFAYVTSGSYGLAIEAKESTVTGFTVDLEFGI